MKIFREKKTHTVNEQTFISELKAQTVSTLPINIRSSYEELYKKKKKTNNSDKSFSSFVAAISKFSEYPKRNTKLSVKAILNWIKNRVI